MAVDVVVCGDKNVLCGMAVTIRTALEHSSRPLRIHVINGGIPTSSIDKLRASWDHKNMESVIFHDLEYDLLKEFRPTIYLKSKVAYARYFISDFLLDEDRCIYLDTDLLVLRDLAELYDMSMGDNIIASVPDISVRANADKMDVDVRLGLKDKLRYFNSGMLLIDLVRYRAGNFAQVLSDISVKMYDRLYSQDQDALNIAFEDHTLLLDPSWNRSQYERPEFVEGQVIHLIGTIKPWHAEYQSKFVDPYYKEVIYDRFYDVLDRTAFAGFRPRNFGGLAGKLEYLRRRTPTVEMIYKKLRDKLAIHH